MKFATNLLNIALATGLTIAVAPAQNTANPPASDKPASTKTMHDAKNDVDMKSMVNPADRKFLMEAAQGGIAEVHLAQLAQQKASSEGVKQAAQKIEADHTKANAALKELAEEKKVDLPTEMGPKQQALMQKLQNLSGEQFDKAYVKAMVQDHKNDIKEFQHHADHSMDSDVKAFASKTVPTLQEHLQLVQQLAGNKDAMGGTRARSSDAAKDTPKP